jgi:hypothetical protein
MPIKNNMETKDVLTKELVKNLLEMEGRARGIHFKNDLDYVTKKEGEGSIKKVEEKLKEAGCPINYEEIKNLDFYPIGWRAISLLAIKDVFGWDEQEFRRLGSFVTAVSLIIRVYMKFFVSIKEAADKAPKIFREYFTRGEIVIPDYSEKKKYVIIEIRDLDFHPLYCFVLEGFLENIVRMIVKPEKIACKETGCTFRGGSCHQFKITWE